MRTEKAFDLLGLDYTASRDEIKNAYKQKVRQLHPDRVGAGANDTEWKQVNNRFSLIQEAYQTLTKSNALGDQAYRIRKKRRQQENRLKQAQLSILPIDKVPESLVEELQQRRQSDQRDQLFFPQKSLQNYLIVAGVSIAFYLFLTVMLGWPLMVVDKVILVVATLITVGAVGMAGYEWWRYLNASIKPGIWILPTDIIMVDYQKVSIAPLLSLRRWTVQQQRRGYAMTMGGRTNQPSLRFRFYNSTMQLQLKSMNQANQIEFAVRYWQKLWKRADDLMEYYREHSFVPDITIGNS